MVHGNDYFFAFYEDDPTVEASSFEKPNGTYNELSRNAVDESDGARTKRRVIIMEVTPAEYTAGFAALSNARKIEGREAANAQAASFADWTDTEIATAKVFADKHEAVKEIITALMTHDAALRAIVLANTQYDTVAKLTDILTPMTYGDYADEIEEKMNE